MSEDINKRIAILEMFKTGQSPSEIFKTLKFNQMLVWRTLKKYEETRKVENQPGQGRPQSAQTQKLIKATRTFGEI